MTEELDNNPFEALRNVSLSQDEKDTLRARVRGLVILARPRSLGSLPARWRGGFAHHIAATLVLVLVLGGGVLWAADSAEPDTTLYSVRTAVNDQVRITAAGDELDRIEKELELIGGYLAEEETVMERELTL